jgi:UDP-N-acetylmuramyl pentapeptide phosphotransferase/UDP-N-acetylglucosamine-1-phosphate transferase
MTAVVLLLAATVLVSGWLTGRLAAPGAWFRILDTPNARSLHATAMPRTGGVAILGGFVFGLVVCLVAARVHVGGRVLADAAQAFGSRDVVTIVAAALLVGAISLWGDQRDVSPGLRLATQCLAAAGLISIGHFVITEFYVPFIGVVPLGWFAFPLTLLFIVWMTNLYNFMDGMDGFAGGMALVGFGFLGGLALSQGAAGLGMLALLLAAAAIGFLLFNYPPARIFMGDVGAVPLGFLAAALAIKGNREKVLGLWVPMIIFSPFIVDATIVLIRRVIRGAKVWEPHREHFYQRLVLAGWSHRRTVCVEYLLMLGWGTVAVVYEWRGEVGHVVVLALGVVVYTLLALGVRLVERQAQARSAPARGGSPVG